MRAAGRSGPLIGARQECFVIELGGQARIALESLISGPLQVRRYAGVSEAAPCQFTGEVAERAALRGEASYEFALQRVDPG